MSDIEARVKQIIAKKLGVDEVKVALLSWELIALTK
jgi:acyl carrier protein